MTGSSLNYLNIGLIFISMLVAFKVPFELFLFSYAVLGPLHYLTEISWLRKRQFFTTGKNDWKLLAGMTTLYTLLFILYVISNQGPMAEGIQSWFGENFQSGMEIISNTTVILIFGALVAAIAMAAFKKTRTKIIVSVAGLILGAALLPFEGYKTIVNVFLPTLIHVLIFTGAFMLYGATKDRSKSGVITFGIFVVAAIFTLYSGHYPAEYFTDVSQGTKDSFDASGFNYLRNVIITGLIEVTNNGIQREDAWVLHGSIRLIAFAYTYHYLNWFSKTSIIGWHKIPRRNLLIVLAIWIASVALYFYDYKVGLLALLFLSVLHVFLEFPLNYHSFVGIGKEGYRWISGQKPGS